MSFAASAGAARESVTAIFRGGTSLSKAYKQFLELGSIGGAMPTDIAGLRSLLAAPDVLADVAASGVDVMARDVCTYSIAAEQAASPRPVDWFAASPAFNNGPHLPIARDEYEQRVIGQLLWPGAAHGSFDDCVAAVHASTRHL